MITISQISVGKGYLTRHLSANDYYSEGEKVVGQWFGKGAEMLGLSGEVDEAAFEALRQNIQPGTGEKLTPRKSQVAFHDITYSAPKSVSVAAIVGGDERLVEAFHQTVETTLREMEKLAAVRVRTGANVRTEAMRRTGNVIAGVFHHDSSRALDPQMHAHAVHANASYDHKRESWYALQPVRMIKESNTSLRSLFYQDLAKRAKDLGYEVEWRGMDFRLKGVNQKLDLVYSQRAVQRQAFEMRHKAVFGKHPSKRRVEQFIKEGQAAATKRFRAEYLIAFGRYPDKNEVGVFVKDWRDPKLARISTKEVRQLQRARMSPSEAEELDALVRQARHGQGDQSLKVEPGQSTKQQLHQVKPNGEPFLGKLKRVVQAVPSALVAESRKRLASITSRTSPKTGNYDPVRMSRGEVLRRLRRGRRMAQALRGMLRGLATQAFLRQSQRGSRKIS